MKVQCIQEYYDKKQDKYIQSGAMLDVDNKRASELIARGVAKAVKKEFQEGNAGADK